ncbi:TIGR02922 family protein [Colwelliaceae bacterium 6471]
MNNITERKVTVIYYSDNSLELLHEVETFLQNEQGRVIIPESFKEDKSIIAVCDGEVDIINKVGDRILSVEYVA